MALLQTFTINSYVKDLQQHAKRPLSRITVLQSASAQDLTSDSAKIESTKQKLHDVLASLESQKFSESREAVQAAVRTLQSLEDQQRIDGLPSDKDQELAALEQAVLNKVVITLYSKTLDVLLSQALEAEREMEWWDEVERSPLNVLYYLLQTLPNRIFMLMNTLRGRLGELNIPMTMSQLTPSSLRVLFPSRGLRPSALITSLFPYLHHSSPSLASSPIFYASQSSQNVAHGPTNPISESLQHIQYFFALPYHLTREECRFKRRKLESIRDDRASALGDLAQERLRLRNSLTSSVCDLNPTINIIKAVIGDQKSLQTQPDTLSVIREFNHTSLVRYQDLHGVRLQSQQLLRPSRLTLLWPRLVLAPPVILYSISRLYYSRGSLLELARETKVVLEGFVVDWVIEPLKGVLDTVRSKDKGVIISKEGVEADLESLERMALSLAKDHLNYTSDQLGELSRQVKTGDLTPVMKLYEEDIRTPLKATLTGTLLRTLFIQVQKAKVDIDQALTGIDRLLKSQELTFAFVGVAPALSILYLTAGYLGRVWTGGRGRGRYGGKRQRASVLFAMRRIERLLIHDKTSQVSSLTAGLLMLSVAQLQSFATRYLPERTRIKEGFLEDVEDLQDPELGGNERRLVLDRMWRSWGGTLGLGTIAGEDITR